MSEQPELRTPRLILRRPRLRDAPRIATLLNNYEVTKNLARVPYPYTFNMAVDWLVRQKRDWSPDSVTFAIVLPDDGLIGFCGMHREGRLAEIGYWLGEPYWGHGFATEAAHALIDLAFRATAIERLHVSCHAINGGSRRVIHKCGFQFSSMGMADSLAAGNVPVERYVLDRRTWIGLRSWQS